MQTSKPLVSVLMTAYNRQQYIGESIESVLASTYTNFELIIVDDRSSDNTYEIAQRYAAKDPRIQVYLNETNLQDYPNRNKAAGYAKGKYLKYLDSDDTIYPEGLEYCVTEMEKYPESSFGLSMLDGDESKSSVLLQSRDIIRESYLVGSLLTAGPTGMIIKRDLFEEIKGFDTRFKMASDSFFNIKVALQSPVVLLKKKFFFYRMHAGQELNNPKGYLIYGFLASQEVMNTLSLPFSKTELKVLRSKMEKQHSRSLIKQLIFKRNFKDVISIMKATDFTLFKLLQKAF